MFITASKDSKGNLKSSIKCINAFREIAKLYIGRNVEYWAVCAMCQSFHRFNPWKRPADFRSRNFYRHSSLKVPSLTHINPIPFEIPLFYKNIMSKDYAIRNKKITVVVFLLSSCDMSLHGKLVIVASHSFKDRTMYWMRSSALILGNIGFLNS